MGKALVLCTQISCFMTDSFEQLEDKVSTLINLENVGSVLSWDQEVMMPDKGVEARSAELSEISALRHDLLSSDKLSQLIEEAEKEDLDREKEAVLREVKKDHERARKVDEDLIQEISRLSAEVVDMWKEAKEKSEFGIVEEDLKELVELKKEYARQIDSDREPYKVLFEDFEPYMEFETVEHVLAKLKQELPELVEKIRDSEVELSEEVFKGDFPEEEQVELNREFLKDMGYDFDRGRFDTSEHPFTAGNQFDTRITTWFNEEDISESIFPSIHEGGHALYNQNLPRDRYGSPLGQSREFIIHESQSRLWENHVARSKPFWNYASNKLAKKFPEFEGVEPEKLYKAANVVDNENLIRVYADEVTYHLHILVRFELERDLINGNIEVEDLPELWNEKMEELLGIEPERDAEGVLQDIHWYKGSFGYFPTYSLGSVLSTQIFKTAEEDIDNLEDKITEGELQELNEWLRDKIHLRGKLLETEELVEEVTGKKPDAEDFLRHIREKYSNLYGI